MDSGWFIGVINPNLCKAAENRELSLFQLFNQMGQGRMSIFREFMTNGGI